MHVIAIGGAGYIGRVAVDRLLAAGHRVTVVDSHLFAEPGPPGASLTIRKLDRRCVRMADLAGADAVVDLAAISNDPSGELDPVLTMAVNLRSRSRLSALARQCGIGRYLLLSSCSVYGAGDGLMEEDGATNPLTTYARGNLLAERAVLSLARPGFAATAFRLATVCGPSPAMRFDLVVNAMSLSAHQKAVIAVDGDGSQSRPLVHVADVAEAIVTALAAPASCVSGEVFNIGHENLSVMDVAREVGAAHGRAEIRVGHGSHDRRNYRASFAKARRVLGLSPARTVRDAAGGVLSGLARREISASSGTVRLEVYRRLLRPASATPVPIPA